MSKDEQSAVIQSGQRVIDNSVPFVASQQQQEQQSSPPEPAAQAPAAQSASPAASEQSAPPAAAEQTAPAATPPATTEQSATGAPAQAGTPQYIQDIQTQLAALNQQLAGGNDAAGNQQQADPMVQLEQQLVDLQTKAENGEITYSEMIRQTAPLIEERATLKVKQDLQQEQEAQQIRSAQDTFLADNPDFLEFIKTPEAQAIRESNPILDNVSAYYAHKASMAAVATNGLQQQLNELKAQFENSIKGAARQQAPLSGSGTEEPLGLPQQAGQPDGLKPFEGGLAALRRARAAQ